MSKDEWAGKSEGIAFLILFAVIFVCTPGGWYATSLDYDRAHKSGCEANKTGIRPEANPFIGGGRGDRWLKGWMDSERSSKGINNEKVD